MQLQNFNCDVVRGNTFNPNLCFLFRNQKKNGSRVVSFHYGGYSDTIYALINGKIYERNLISTLNDSLLPLGNVKIIAEQNNKTAFTNSDGEFIIGLEKGVFSLLITKEGYQSLRITNYVSDPDQISGARIILEKGINLRTFEIPKPAIK